MQQKKKYIFLSLLFLVVIVLFFITYLVIDVGKKKTEQELMLEQTSALGNYLLQYYPISDITKLSNQDRLYYAFIAVHADDKKYIAARDIEAVIKDVFDLSVVHEDVVDAKKQKLFTYNAKKERYEKVENTYYFTGFQYGLLTDIVELTKKEDTYVIKTRNLFVEDTTEDQKQFQLYLSYSDYQKNKNSIYTVMNRDKFNPISIIHKYQDQIPVITYTYQLVNDRYVIRSII